MIFWLKYGGMALALAAIAFLVAITDPPKWAVVLYVLIYIGGWANALGSGMEYQNRRR